MVELAYRRATRSGQFDQKAVFGKMKIGAGRPAKKMRLSGAQRGWLCSWDTLCSHATLTLQERAAECNRKWGTALRAGDVRKVYK